MGRFRVGTDKVLNANTSIPEILALNGKKCTIEEIELPAEMYKVRVYTPESFYEVTVKREELLPYRRSKLDKDMDRYRRFKEEIYRLYREAREYTHILDRLCERRNEWVYNKPEYAKMSEWAKSKVRGYDDALWNVLQREWLEPRWLVNGEWLTADKITEWRCATECREFWKGTEVMFHPVNEKRPILPTVELKR